MIKTSIIIPVYNTEKYVKECIYSVLNQTEKNIEIIIVNDGSIDGSDKVIREIKKEHSEIIYIVSEENVGPGHSRNIGVENAHGEYILFLDSDDYLKSNTVEVCYKYASANSADFVMFDSGIFGDTDCISKNIYDRSTIIKEQYIAMNGANFFNNYYNKTLCVSPCLVYLSRSFLLKNNIRFLDTEFYEDNLFHCEIMSESDMIIYIPQKLYCRRYRHDSITTSKFDLKRAKSLITITENIYCLNYPNTKNALRIIASNLLESLVYRCKNNNMLEDREMLDMISSVIMRMYGEDYEDIKYIKEAEIVLEIYHMLYSDLDNKIERKLCQRIKELLLKLLKEIPLDDCNKKIGIYGMGKCQKHFADIYHKYLGPIKSEIVYIVSSDESMDIANDGRRVINVKNISNEEFALILIATSKYEDEMKGNIDRYGTNKQRVVCLQSDLHVV